MSLLIEVIVGVGVAETDGPCCCTSSVLIEGGCDQYLIFGRFMYLEVQ